MHHEFKYIPGVYPPHDRTLLQGISFPKGDPEPKALPGHFSSSPDVCNPELLSLFHSLFCISIRGITQQVPLCLPTDYERGFIFFCANLT